MKPTVFTSEYHHVTHLPVDAQIRVIVHFMNKYQIDPDMVAERLKDEITATEVRALLLSGSVSHIANISKIAKAVVPYGCKVDFTQTITITEKP